MARQTFEKGQTVYVARYSRNHWRKAVVANPDIEKTAYGFGPANRTIHYVGISYVKDDGTVDEGNEWPILNNRQQIVTAERYAEIAQANDIAKLRGTIRAHRKFEEDLDRFTKQATAIINTMVTRDGSIDVLELALHLRGVFSFRSSYIQQTAAQVARTRAEYLAGAHKAQTALHKLGVQPPELAL